MKVVLLRVGIDTGAGGIHGPLFADGTFEYIPIPDSSGRDERTYGNTIGRMGRPLIDYFPGARRPRMSEQPMHVDPEFDTFTYGDPGPAKRGLARLEPGDLLVFYAGLEGWDHPSPPALYIIGYFEIAYAGRAGQFSERQRSDLFAGNAHVRIPMTFAEQPTDLVLVKGRNGSRLLSNAVLISATGRNRAGQPLKILSPEMQSIFGHFEGKVSIQRSPARMVAPDFVERAGSFVRSLT